METDLIAALTYVGRFNLSAWLFTIAGVILVISHPRWRGSWLLLAGGILLVVLTAGRLAGFPPRDAVIWVLLAAEAGGALGYLLAGLGTLLVSMRARKEPA